MVLVVVILLHSSVVHGIVTIVFVAARSLFCVTLINQPPLSLATSIEKEERMQSLNPSLLPTCPDHKQRRKKKMGRKLPLGGGTKSLSTTLNAGVGLTI